MKKQYFYLAGLPRSGSTVLCNILLQNPDVYASSTSSLPIFIESVKNQWDDKHRHLSKCESRTIEKGVLQGIIDGYYAHIDKPIIIDKSRNWPNLMETLTWVFDKEPKVIACVRDVRQTLESFEELFRETLAVGMPSQFANGFVTMEQRADAMATREGPVGSAYEILRDAVSRGWKDQILFVRYEDLGGNPASVIHNIYKFLELEPFDHDFNNIVQLTKEDDRVHKFEGLHDIEPKLRPAKLRSNLGQFGEKFGNLNFWENL